MAVLTGVAGGARPDPQPPHRPRTRRRDPAETPRPATGMAPSPRERLVTHALAVLEAEGVDAVTVRRVAREAGVSHGAPLRHFSTRADLLAAVAATGFAQLQAV